MVTQQPDLSEDQLVPQVLVGTQLGLFECCTFARPLFML